MSHKQAITSTHRTLFVIAIDQSGSMQEHITAQDYIFTKSQIAAITASALIDELYYKAKRYEGIRNYYDIAVLGYSGYDIVPLLHPTFFTVPISMLDYKNVPRLKIPTIYRSSEGRPLIIDERISQWVTPKAGGFTSTIEMLDAVTDLVDRWCSASPNRDSFPPTVFNISDGNLDLSYRNTLLSKADKLKRTGTTDGNTMLFNIHIASNIDDPQLFCPSLSDIPADHPALPLAPLSSELPAIFHPAALGYDKKATSPLIALSSNTMITRIISCINMGSYSIIPTTDDK